MLPSSSFTVCADEPEIEARGSSMVPESRNCGAPLVAFKLRTVFVPKRLPMRISAEREMFVVDDCEVFVYHGTLSPVRSSTRM